MRRKFGFTLTEILVALGVIGIVSAITVPVLTNNWQKKAHTTKLHKVYNDFEHAFERLMTDKRVSNLAEAGVNTTAGMYGTVDSTNVKNFLHTYFKVVKDCGYGSSSGCFAPKYRTLNGTLTENPSFSGYNVLLANGVAVAYSVNNINATAIKSLTYGSVTVDVNGVQGPNIAGRDLFTMYVFPDGVLDVRGNTMDSRNSSDAKTQRSNLFLNECKSTLVTTGCFGKLLNDNWVMNY